MRTPAQIKMPESETGGEVKLSTVEEGQIPAWKVALLRAREAERAEATFDDAPPANTATLSHRQRRDVEEALRKELPRFDKAEADSGRRMTPVSPYDSKGRLLRERPKSELDDLPQTQISTGRVLLTGLLVFGISLGLMGLLFVMWLLATALEAL